MAAGLPPALSPSGASSLRLLLFISNKLGCFSPSGLDPGFIDRCHRPWALRLSHVGFAQSTSGCIVFRVTSLTVFWPQCLALAWRKKCQKLKISPLFGIAWDIITLFSSAMAGKQQSKSMSGFEVLEKLAGGKVLSLPKLKTTKNDRSLFTGSRTP